MSYQSLLAHMSEILGAVHRTLDVLTHVASTTAQIAPMFGPQGAKIAAIAGTVGSVAGVLESAVPENAPVPTAVTPTLIATATADVANATAKISPLFGGDGAQVAAVAETVGIVATALETPEQTPEQTPAQ